MRILHSKDSVLRAIAECKRLGRDAFLREYGFRRARTYALLHEGDEFDSKAIYGVACKFEDPRGVPLRSAEFSGGEHTVARRLRDLGFVITRRGQGRGSRSGTGAVQRQSSAPSTHWNEDENRPIVSTYFEMLKSELSGEPVNKAERNRELRVDIPSRNRGSVDFKHGNISAILLSLGLPPISGYKPAPNYQRALEESVRAHLHAHPRLIKFLEDVAASSPKKSIWNALARPDRRVDPPPSIVKDGSARASRLTAPMSVIDYAERERRNRELGIHGEEFALIEEKRRLEDAGRLDLARGVEWTSKTRGDSLGYDIRSFEPETSRELFIEVKTTNAGKYTAFFVSRNEVLTSEELRSQYRLFRLFDFTHAPHFFVLDGALQNTCELSAQSYRATAK